MSIDWSDHFAPRMAGMNSSEVRELLKLLAQPDIVSFAGGIPDPDLFPVDAVAAAYQRVLTSNSLRTSALQYAVSEGHAPLRAWIAGQMGVDVPGFGLDDVIMTSGSQQGLDFVGKLLIGAGDLVAVTDPTFLGALQAFSAYEPRYVGVAMDDQGPDLDALGRALARGPKFFYLVPDFQNPTGVSTSLERRVAIVEMCARAGVPIVEDAAYVKLRYEGEELPTLFALDAQRAAAAGGVATAGNVVHLGTFSKTLAPALRVGWAAGPQAVINRMVLIKQAADLQVSTINQMVVTELVDGVFAAQLPRLRLAYKARRDAMLAALDAELAGLARWTRPAGGMFVWLELPEGVDAAALLQRAVADAKLAFVPGAGFFHDRGRINTARFSFSLARPEGMRSAFARLAPLIRDAAASP